MSIYKLKPAFQNLLRPAVNVLARKGITANQITLAALVLSFITSLFLFFTGPGAWWLLLPVVLFVRMAMNAVDGMLAREHNMQSSLGYVLNEICDLVSDAAVYLCFYTVTGFNSFWLFVFVLLAWLSEVIAILIHQISGSRANQGPMGKSDRAFVFSVFAILLSYFGDLSQWAPWLLAAINLLMVITLFRRLRTLDSK